MRWAWPVTGVGGQGCAGRNDDDNTRHGGEVGSSNILAAAKGMSVEGGLDWTLSAECAFDPKLLRC